MFKKIAALLGSLVLSACADDIKQEHLAALQLVADGAILIDVRTDMEFSAGHLPDALNIPHTKILPGVTQLGLAKEQAIVLYCRSGNRSGQATATLLNAGYTNVTNAGAYDSLLAASQHGCSPSSNC